jgi:hypothetical protein
MGTQCEEQREFHFDQDLAKEIEREGNLNIKLFIVKAIKGNMY